jgi:hypothetical protein
MKEQQATLVTREMKKAATNKNQALAAKIRDWDELSNGQIKTSNEQRDSRKSIDKDHREMSHPSPAPSKWNRTHPWDGEIPPRLDKVETRDTSMENAAGIEVALPQVGRTDEESLEESRAEQPRAKQKHFAKNFPRDKSLLEVFPDDPSFFPDAMFPDPKDLEGKPMRPSQEIRAPVPSRPVTISQMTPIQTSRVEDTRVPSATQSTVPSQTPLSPQRTPVNPFSSEAMVAMPYDESLPTMNIPVLAPLATNDLFPEILLDPESDTITSKQNSQSQQQPAQKRDGRRRTGPVDTDESFDTIYSSQRPGPASCLPVWKSDFNRSKNTLERGAIEVSLEHGEFGMLDTSADTSTSLEIFGVNQKIENSDSGVAKNKRRGFLRAFMRNKDKKKNESSGSKSESQATPSSDPRPVPHIFMQPVLPAFHPDASSATGRGRNEGRLDDRSPQMPRSASVDRFRSRNMAQKFGRMMSLYDKD